MTKTVIVNDHKMSVFEAGEKKPKTCVYVSFRDSLAHL